MITRGRVRCLPKKEQDKAINQSKAPSAPKQSAPVLPPMATRKDGDVIEVGGVKRSWNSQANGGKGGWGVVQAAPVAPAKPRGLMPEAGAATMPQNTPETPSLADRAERPEQKPRLRDSAKIRTRARYTPAPTSTTTDLTPIGLTATGAKVEAEYQALLNKDVSAIEFAKRLGKLLNDPEFRNNHTDLVKRYKIYQSEAADEVNKGSR